MRIPRSNEDLAVAAFDGVMEESSSRPVFLTAYVAGV
jgi:hypothetical protein